MLTVRKKISEIVISEHIEFDKPVCMHHYTWQSFSQQSYDRFHSASILLPVDNYYIVGHSFDSSTNGI